MRRAFQAGWLWCAVLLILVSADVARGQDQSRGFVVKVHRDEQGGLHKYVVFIPQGYTPEKKWPAILYLHGAGECGTDGLKPTTMGPAPYIKAREATFPFFAVFPQCEDQSGRILTRWAPEGAESQRALKILDEVQKEYSIDSGKVALTGWSMGGYGAWELLLSNPDRWSAIVPVAGGVDDPMRLSEGAISKLNGKRIWAFHGALDNLIQADTSRAILDQLKRQDVAATYTELPQGDHGVWRQIYGSDELYRWLGDPASPPNEALIANAPLTTAVPPGPFERAISDAPFINSLYIPRAITVRLGNDMLAAVSDAIPGMVPASTLSGHLGDMYDSTSASGRSFSVQMSGITYATRLHRVLVKSVSSGNVLMQIGLQRIDMQIGGTYISGGPRSASVGPINITVGTQQPVWLNISVKPRIEAGKVRLEVTGTDFNIQDNNWAYSQPGGISTRGLGMTQDRVYDGVMSGMAGSKPRIESQVKSLVPSLVKQLEDRIEYSQFDQLIAGMWPLPMTMPRVLTWPQELSVDGNGLTLTLGATVGAITEEQKKAKPRWAKMAEKKALNLSRDPTLFVGIDPEILKPISEMAVEAGEAKINVLDTPARSLAVLSDPVTMSELIPELKKYGNDVQLVSELVLRKSVGFNHSGGKGAVPAGESQLDIEVPELLVQLALRSKEKSKGLEPFAELAVAMNQQAAVRLIEPDFQTRALEMDWGEQPQLTSTARFTDEKGIENKTIEKDKWSEIILKGWNEFTNAGHAARMVIPDVQVGVARLRATRLRKDGGLIGVSFTPPSMRLRNRSPNPITYEVKILSSNWSSPYTLKAGQKVRFNVPTDMLVRLKQGEKELLYNLPAGSSNVFKSAKEGAAPALYAEGPKDLEEDDKGSEEIEHKHDTAAGSPTSSSGTSDAPPPPAE